MNQKTLQRAAIAASLFAVAGAARAGDSYAEERSLVGRVGRPEDVAALTEFLLSDRAGYITGEVYGVSGGVAPNA